MFASQSQTYYPYSIVTMTDHYGAENRSSPAGIAVSLETNPRLNFTRWETSVYEFADVVGQGVSEHGVMSEVMDDQALAALPNNTIIDSNGNRHMKPRPNPQEPTKPAEGESYDRYKVEKAEYEKFIAAKAALKKALLQSIGPANVKLLSHARFGTKYLTNKEIVDRMRNLYGIITEEAINAIKAQMKAPMDSTRTFEDHIIELNSLFSQLADSGYGIHEYEKLQYLRESTNTHPDVVECVREYYKKVPQLGKQNYQDCVAIVVEMLPTMTTTSKFGYAAAMTPVNIEELVRAEVERRLTATAATAQTVVVPAVPPSAQFNKNSTSGHAGGGRGAAASNQSKTRGGKKNKTGSCYCYVHGYNDTHEGAACRHMLNYPVIFKPVMHAQDPTDVPAGHTLGNNK